MARLVPIPSTNLMERPVVSGLAAARMIPVRHWAITVPALFVVTAMPLLKLTGFLHTLTTVRPMRPI
ncbi:hypothetical protein [Glaciimonas soli]